METSKNETARPHSDSTDYTNMIQDVNKGEG